MLTSIPFPCIMVPEETMITMFYLSCPAEILSSSCFAIKKTRSPIPAVPRLVDTSAPSVICVKYTTSQDAHGNLLRVGCWVPIRINGCDRVSDKNGTQRLFFIDVLDAMTGILTATFQPAGAVEAIWLEHTFLIVDPTSSIY